VNLDTVWTNQVIVQAVHRDRDGRIVGEGFISISAVSAGGRAIAECRIGAISMAYVYRQYARSCSQMKVLDDLERQTKAGRKGIWARDYQKHV
jgi:endonuclease YncB( thermonuclease family)